METRKIRIGYLHPNEGQIDGVPKNPRFIRDEKFKALKKSIEDDPEMLELRELGVYEVSRDNFIVLLGNMRLQALKELGYDDAVCKVIPKGTPAEKLRSYTMKDNIAYGETDWDIIANEWDAEELTGWGMDIPMDFGGGHNIENKSGEIDTDEFGDKVSIKFEFSQEEWAFINSKLQQIDANKENAILKALGYGKQ